MKTLTQELIECIESSPIPVSTPDLIAICATEKSNPRQRVWTILRELEQNGIVRRLPKKVNGVRLWTHAALSEVVESQDEVTHP